MVFYREEMHLKDLATGVVFDSSNRTTFIDFFISQPQLFWIFVSFCYISKM